MQYRIQFSDSDGRIVSEWTAVGHHPMTVVRLAEGLRRPEGASRMTVLDAAGVAARTILSDTDDVAYPPSQGPEETMLCC